MSFIYLAISWGLSFSSLLRSWLKNVKGKHCCKNTKYNCEIDSGKRFRLKEFVVRRFDNFLDGLCVHKFGGLVLIWNFDITFNNLKMVVMLLYIRDFEWKYYQSLLRNFDGIEGNNWKILIRKFWQRDFFSGDNIECTVGLWYRNTKVTLSGFSTGTLSGLIYPM